MNTKKNILILSPFFYPEPISTGKFNSEVAIALKEKGHNVTVLCFHPFYPDWEIKKSILNLDGIKIVRGGNNLKFSKKTIIRRFTLELGYAFFVVKKIKKYQKKCDVIIPVFPPSFAFYTVLSFLNKKIKKVGMVHDLQEVYTKNKKGIVNKLVSFFINKIESRCYNSCDKLIFLSNEMNEVAKKLYNLHPSKLETQYPFHSLKNEITNDLGSVLVEKNVNIVYSGALGEKQNPKGLYNFFNFASSKIENVYFHFFSQGNVFNELKNDNKNDRIKFHNLVEQKNLEELYLRSDIQIIPQLPETSKGSLPSKLPNLLVSGCDILVITDKGSEIEKLFRINNFKGVTTSWENENLLEIVKYILKNKNENKNQKKIAKKLFTLDEMIDKIIQ